MIFPWSKAVQYHPTTWRKIDEHATRKITEIKHVNGNNKQYSNKITTKYSNNMDDNKIISWLLDLNIPGFNIYNSVVTISRDFKIGWSITLLFLNRDVTSSNRQSTCRFERPINAATYFLKLKAHQNDGRFIITPKSEQTLIKVDNMIF